MFCDERTKSFINIGLAKVVFYLKSRFYFKVYFFVIEMFYYKLKLDFFSYLQHQGEFTPAF